MRHSESQCKRGFQTHGARRTTATLTSNTHARGRRQHSMCQQRARAGLQRAGRTGDKRDSAQRAKVWRLLYRTLIDRCTTLNSVHRTCYFVRLHSRTRSRVGLGART